MNDRLSLQERKARYRINFERLSLYERGDACNHSKPFLPSPSGYPNPNCGLHHKEKKPAQRFANFTHSDWFLACSI